MVWIYYMLLLLVAAAGLFMVMLTLPGLWLMAAASAGYCLLTHRHYLGGRTLIALLILALLSEAAEIGIGGAAARKAGGGRRGDGIPLRARRGRSGVRCRRRRHI